MKTFKEIGIWSWGHVIYDYKGFFKNMKALGMNKITIWNDFAPINAKEIIEFAHKYDISVVWGFSWGWSTDCKNTVDGISEERLNLIKQNVLKTFCEQYKDISSDGIYFQSFTEIGENETNEKSVAEAVVELVNSTAVELYKINPELNIEFGLHATAVKNNLDIIAKTDSKIKIIWEDLGAFPFSYNPLDVDDFYKTYMLTEKVINLRGNSEKCGFIIKGMTTLDWSHFKHAECPLIIGESDYEFIKNRQLEKEDTWQEYTNGWSKNTEYAEKMFGLLKSSKNVVSVEALIEDGMFENEIKEPARLFARLCEN